MDKVLIVDSDPDFLERLKESISKLHQFDVLCAHDGKEAVEILSTEKVSVFVTDTNTAKVDGLELLAHVSRHCSGVPCVVMSSYGKPWFCKSMDQKESLYHVEKPVNLVSLVSAIFVGLNLRDENQAGKGFSLASFLPLVEMERKTCRLEVGASSKGKGFLYFDEGVLIDAHYKELTSEEAASEMVSWKNVGLTFGELPRRRNQKRVEVNLMEKIGATWEKMCSEEEPLEPLEPETEPETEPANRESPVADSFKKIEQDPVRKILRTQIEKFRTIKGYKAIGILDFGLNPIATDFSGKKVDLKSLAVSFKPVFYLCSKITERHNFSKCRMFMVHTDQAVVQISLSEPVNSDPFFLIGVTETSGNWFFVKFEMEKLERQLTESLAK